TRSRSYRLRFAAQNAAGPSTASSRGARMTTINACVVRENPVFKKDRHRRHVDAPTEGMNAHERNVPRQAALASAHALFDAVRAAAAGGRDGSVYHGEHA